MDVNKSFLARLDSYTYLDLTVTQWLALFVLAAGLWMALRFALRKTTGRFQLAAERTVSHWDDMLVKLLESTHGLLIFVLAFYAAAVLVGTPEHTKAIFYKAVVVGLFFQAAIWGRMLVEYGLRRYLMKRNHLQDGEAVDISAYSAMSMSAKFLLFAFLFLLLLDNLGVNITALVTGLGIGGIAIALAMQNILGDMFASLSIVLDRPFEVGDFIIVGDKMGTVENIGLKTSRIKSLSGEQLIFPNKTLIEKEISNFKRMQTRRIVFSFGVTYETPLERLKEIPDIIKAIIISKPNTSFDRAHFLQFGKSSLDFEAVYIMQVADYNTYMDIQQAINFELMEELRARDIAFAYPTRTIVLQAEAAAKVQETRIHTNGLQAN